ncbi:hypothetical protein C1H46_024632 [Malus baccata]|uniref:Uncharacterized protein n=1 Tax=Malus baccata TaxID=106549 RepID=A0A540LTT0_MALBA|nr:hypothetical protein C1H46_024632 [Malus baccata]
MGLELPPPGPPLWASFTEYGFYGFKPIVCALCCIKTREILQCPERKYFPQSSEDGSATRTFECVKTNDNTLEETKIEEPIAKDETALADYGVSIESTPTKIHMPQIPNPKAAKNPTKLPEFIISDMFKGVIHTVRI